MNIALKDAAKPEFWLQLLPDSDFMDDKQFASIHTDCKKLLKLLRLSKSITKPTRRPPPN